MDKLYAQVTRNIIDIVGVSIEQYDGPFIPNPGKPFQEASSKILYVGQEPYGWSRLDQFTGKNSIVDIRKTYSHFDFNAGNKSTPFWDFHRKLSMANGLTYNSILWSNLSKFSMRPKNGSASILQSPLRDEIIDAQLGLLTKEIQQHDVEKIIFVTGPKYDWIIEQEFPECRFEALTDKYNERQLARVIIPQFPTLTAFRTYHPAYLRRAKITQDVLGYVT